MPSVLVIDADRLSPFFAHFEGGILPNPAVAEVVLASVLPFAYFTDRGPAETNEELLQVVPYCLLETADPPAAFVYARSKAGGENRLHDRLSLGVGGHVDRADGEVGPGGEQGGADAYAAGLRRELLEEVGLDLPKDAAVPVAGLIYDRSDAVGRVHLGVVHRILVPAGVRLTFSDPALADGAFWFAEDIRRQTDRFESWSRLVIDRVLGV